jgi:hypothetical protein
LRHEISWRRRVVPASVFDQLLDELQRSPDATMSDERGAVRAISDSRLKFFRGCQYTQSSSTEMCCALRGHRGGRQRAAAFFQRHRKLSAPARERHDQGILPQKTSFANEMSGAPGELLFTGHRGTQYANATFCMLASEWIGRVGPDPRLFGTHTLRRTKAALICRRTGNLRAVQLLLGQTQIESTVGYFGNWLCRADMLCPKPIAGLRQE